MFCLAALVPSPPVLVPELCGGPAVADPETAPDATLGALRSEVLAVGAALAEAASQWIVLGVGSTEQRYDTDTVGTFRGFGRDVRVSLGGPADGSAQADPGLPLAVLIAGWLRGAVAPHATARAHLVAADGPAQRCAEIGAKLRAELDATDEPRGVLVVADGAATLSQAAPGYFDARAAATQAELERALTGGDRAALLELDPGLCAELMLSGRAAYQTLAGLFAADTEQPETVERYRDSPFGVGYYAGLWRPGGGPR